MSLKLSFQQKILAGSAKEVVLLRGTNRYGYRFYMYIVPDEGMREQIDLDYENGTMQDFESYGKVIKHGLGGNPPEAVQKYMKLVYGFDHPQD